MCGCRGTKEKENCKTSAPPLFRNLLIVAALAAAHMAKKTTISFLSENLAKKGVRGDMEAVLLWLASKIDPLIFVRLLPSNSSRTRRSALGTMSVTVPFDDHDGFVGWIGASLGNLRSAVSVEDDNERICIL